MYTKQWMFALAILCSSVVYNVNTAEIAGKWQAPLVRNNGQPAQPLLDLLSYLGVMHDGTMDGIMSATQLAWLRKTGTERWEMEDPYADRREALLTHLDNLGCVQAVEPMAQRYDYALVFGASIHALRSRLAYFFELYERGIRCNTVVILTGARPRDLTVENDDTLCDVTQQVLPVCSDWQRPARMPTTEAEIVQFLLNQAVKPQDFDMSCVVVVDTPMQPVPGGGIRRPTTADTVRCWLAKNPKAGSCLLISSQPYVGYQDITARLDIPNTFELETVGRTISPKMKMSVALDNVARWIFQEQTLRAAQA